MAKILILNGPNLNKLGEREPEIYGTETLNDIEGMSQKAAKGLGLEIEFRQSNHEGELVDWIQNAQSEYFKGLIINAAAYTHTSIAIHDALKLLHIPVIEVHLSNPKKREPFRHHSYIESVASAVFQGHGAKGYVMALKELKNILS